MNARDLRIVTRIAKRIRKKLLTEQPTTDGCCYDASRMIARELRKLGYKPKLVQGDVKLDGTGIFARGFHFWLELDGRVIDVTGDQFNNEIEGDRIPEIVIEPICKLNRYIKTKYEPLYLAR